MKLQKRLLAVAVATTAVLPGLVWSEATLQDVMKARGLPEKDILVAAQTYIPTGGRDEYLAMTTNTNSHRGNNFATITSLKMLNPISTPDIGTWQGY